MSKLKKMKCLVGLMLICFCFLFVGCNNGEGNKENVVGEFDGIGTICLSVDDTEYDFKSGVKFILDDGSQKDFTVDSSNVLFGESGEYVIKYSCGKKEETTTVKIYGYPEINFEDNISISYRQAVEGTGFKDKIVCKDSFGETLECSFGEFQTQNGAIISGENEIEVKCSDFVGNETSENVKVNISNPDKTVNIEDISVDLADAIKSFSCEGSVLRNIYYDNNLVQDNNYIYNNGYVMLLPTFFELLGVCEEEEVSFNFNDCYTSIKITVTDNCDVNYLIEGDDIDGNYFIPNSSVNLPKAVLSENSIQNAEFRYYLQKENGEKQLYLSDTITDEQNNVKYNYYIEIYKNDVFEKEIVQTFGYSTLKYASQNIAVGKFSNIWYKNTASSSLTFDNEITDDYEITKNAVEFYKPKASGVYTCSNFFYLDKDLINKAKENGFTMFKFSYLTKDNPSEDVVRDTGNSSYYPYCFELYSYDSVQNKTTKNLLYNQKGANNAWISTLVDISSLDTDLTLLFNVYGTTCYIADAYFVGNSAICDDIDFDESFISLDTLKYWNVYGGSKPVSIELKDVTINETTKKAVKVNFPLNDGMWPASNKVSCISLDKGLIEAAINCGYGGISFYVSTDDALQEKGSYPYYFTLSDYSGTGSASISAPLKAKPNAYGQWYYYVVNFNDFKNGTMAFANLGTILYIADVEFIKAVDVSSIDYDGNFATEEYADCWGKTGGEVTYNQSVSSGGVEKTGALKWTGTSSWSSCQVLYLAPEVIAEAVSQGYSKLEITYGGTNSVGIYVYSGAGTKINLSEADQSVKASSTNAYKTNVWATVEILLSDLGTGTVGIGMVNSATVGIVDVKFVKPIDYSTFDYDGNFATEEYADCWLTTGGEVTYNQSVSSGGVEKTGALKWTGTSTWNSCQILYLAPEVIAEAVAQGYSKLEITYGGNSAVGIYKYSGAGTKINLDKADQSVKASSTNAYKTNVWATVEILLSDLGTGTVGIGMVNSTTVGIVDVKFVKTIDYSTFDYNGNFATEEYADCWHINTGTATYTLEYNQTVSGQSGAMKLSASGSTYAKGYVLYLDAGVIEAAKAKGMTTIKFSYVADSSVGAYVYSGSGLRNGDGYISGKTAYKSNCANTWYTTSEIELSNFTEGTTLCISMIGSTYIAIKNVIFQ